MMLEGGSTSLANTCQMEKDCPRRRLQKSNTSLNVDKKKTKKTIQFRDAEMFYNYNKSKKDAGLSTTLIKKGQRDLMAEQKAKTKSFII